MARQPYTPKDQDNPKKVLFSYLRGVLAEAMAQGYSAHDRGRLVVALRAAEDEPDLDIKR